MMSRGEGVEMEVCDGCRIVMAEGKLRDVILKVTV